MEPGQNEYYEKIEKLSGKSLLDFRDEIMGDLSYIEFEMIDNIDNRKKVYYSYPIGSEDLIADVLVTGSSPDPGYFNILLLDGDEKGIDLAKYEEISERIIDEFKKISRYPELEILVFNVRTGEKVKYEGWNEE